MSVSSPPEPDSAWLEAEEPGEVLSWLVTHLVKEVCRAAIAEMADSGEELGVASVMHDGEGCP
jgi:hypothetical protein